MIQNNSDRFSGGNILGLRDGSRLFLSTTPLVFRPILIGHKRFRIPVPLSEVSRTLWTQLQLLRDEQLSFDDPVYGPLLSDEGIRALRSAAIARCTTSVSSSTATACRRSSRFSSHRCTPQHHAAGRANKRDLCIVIALRLPNHRRSADTDTDRFSRREFPMSHAKLWFAVCGGAPDWACLDGFSHSTGHESRIVAQCERLPTPSARTVFSASRAQSNTTSTPTIRRRSLPPRQRQALIQPTAAPTRKPFSARQFLAARLSPYRSRSTDQTPATCSFGSTSRTQSRSRASSSVVAAPNRTCPKLVIPGRIAWR